jgi:hypothetical protein
MSQIFRTLIVPKESVELARFICEKLAGTPGAGMFIRGLSVDGKAPATHFVSSGFISEQFSGALQNPKIILTALKKLDPPVSVDIEDIKKLLASSIVSTGEYTTTDLDGKPVTIQEDILGLIKRNNLVFVEENIL